LVWFFTNSVEVLKYGSGLVSHLVKVNQIFEHP